MTNNNNKKRRDITRNTPDYDQSYVDSKILASRIQAYWRNKGYSKVKVWVEERLALSSDRKSFDIRSNITFKSKDAEIGSFV